MSTQAHLDPEPQDALSRQLTRALETPRPFTVPANFAARIAAAAAEFPRPVATRTVPSFATLGIRSAYAVLALAMLALAAWAHSASNTQQVVAQGTEVAFALEFVALTTWLSLRPRPSY